MYIRYKNFYNCYSTDKGYYDACVILAFTNNPWVNKYDYLDKISEQIKSVQTRMRKKYLTMGDLCSGDYAWLVRHFSNAGKKILCVDLNKSALNNISNEFQNESRKLKLILGDVRDNVIKKDLLDFAYCGFNFYSDFVDPIITYLKPKGGYLFMKPKSGDDLTLRQLVRNYNLEARAKEIKTITSELDKKSKISYEEVKFIWQFRDFDIDQIIAALSVVCLGTPISALTEKEYELVKNYINSCTTCTNGKILTLSQLCSIWIGFRD